MRALSHARRRVLIAIAVLGLGAYLWLAVRLDAQGLSEGLSALGWSGVAAVLGLSLVNYLLRFWRWRGYLSDLGAEVPSGLHLLYYLGGFAFTVSPGKAGEAVRALYLQRHEVPLAKTLAALFAERVLDLMAVCLLAIACAGAITGYRNAAIALGLVVMLGAWLLGRPGFAHLLDRRAARTGPRFSPVLRASANTLRAASVLLAPKRLYPGLLLGLLAWGAEGYGLYLLGHALQLPLTVEAGVAIYAIGVLGGAMSFFMPGGLGGMEATTTALLVKTAGASLATAAAVTLLCRFATLWFAVLLGLVALILLELLSVQPRPPLLPKVAG